MKLHRSFVYLFSVVLAFLLLPLRFAKGDVEINFLDYIDCKKIDNGINFKNEDEKLLPFIGKINSLIENEKKKEILAYIADLNEQYPQSSLLRTKEICLLLTDKKIKKAAIAAEKLSVKEPENEMVLFSKIFSLYKKNWKDPQIEKLAIIGHKKYKSNVTFPLILISHAAASKKYREVVQYCNEILQILPDETKIYFMRAWGFFGHENWQAAVDDFTLYLQKIPSDVNGLFYRAICYSKLGQEENAKKDFAMMEKLGVSRKKIIKEYSEPK